MTALWTVAVSGFAPDGVDARGFREDLVGKALEAGWPQPHSDGCSGSSFQLGWTVEAAAPETLSFIGLLLDPDSGIDLRQLSVSRADDGGSPSIHDGLSEKYKVIVSALSAGERRRRAMSDPQWSSVTEQ